MQSQKNLYGLGIKWLKILGQQLNCQLTYLHVSLNPPTCGKINLPGHTWTPAWTLSTAANVKKLPLAKYGTIWAVKQWKYCIKPVG